MTRRGRSCVAWTALHALAAAAPLLLAGCATTSTPAIPYYSRTGLDEAVEAPAGNAAAAPVKGTAAAAAPTSAAPAAESTGSAGVVVTPLASPDAVAANAAGATPGNGANAAAAHAAAMPEFPLATANIAGELRFRAGDQIKVSIWGYPELDQLATVQPNGRITLPLAGEVEAAGLTQAELRDRIVELLQPYTRAADAELRPGDTLTMEVWQQADLKYTAVIEPGGMATFPLAGRVQASGRPLEEIRAELERRLLRYLREARVSLLPVYNNRRVLHDLRVSVVATQLELRHVAVMGEVNNPGMPEIRGSLRLVDALARSQLRESSAELNGVIVIRNTDTPTPAYRVLRVGDFLAGKAPDQNIFLQNGDVIIVPKSTIAKVDEFVDQWFTRTAPVFNWWFSGFEAVSSKARFDSIRLINEALRRQLTAVSVTPP